MSPIPHPTSEPLHFQGGPWDGFDMPLDEHALSDVVEIRSLETDEVSFYERLGDSRTYQYVKDER